MPLQHDTAMLFDALAQRITEQFTSDSILQALILVCGSLAAATPYLGVILLVIIAAWLKAASRLATEFSELQAKRAQEEIESAGSGGGGAGASASAA